MSWPDSASNRHSRHADCTLISTCMKIAQIPPLAECVPPRLYGGTERVVSYLADELVRLGHDVTLFASGESRTAARLVACAPRALRLDPGEQGHVVPEAQDRKSTRLNSSHSQISYAVFCLKKKTTTPTPRSSGAPSTWRFRRGSSAAGRA